MKNAKWKIFESAPAQVALKSEAKERESLDLLLRKKWWIWMLVFSSSKKEKKYYVHKKSAIDTTKNFKNKTENDEKMNTTTHNVLYY